MSDPQRDEQKTLPDASTTPYDPEDTDAALKLGADDPFDDDPFDEDLDDEDAAPTEERDIEQVFGRNKGDEQNGKYFFCWQMGNPGDFIRDLGPRAEFQLARVPNKRYQAAYDALEAKYERRGGKQIPKKVLRAELPKIYAQFIFVGMRHVKFQGKYLADTYNNRVMLLTRYQPDLMDAIFRHAKDLLNFQDEQPVDDGFKPEFISAEQDAALGNASSS